MTKYLSRHVTVDGKDIGLAIVTVDGESVSVSPFVGEEAGVSYRDESISIDTRHQPTQVAFIRRETLPKTEHS